MSPSTDGSLGRESAAALVDMIRDVARHHDLIVALGDLAARAAEIPGVRAVAVLVVDEFAVPQVAALSDHALEPTELITRLRVSPVVIESCQRREVVVDPMASSARWSALVLDGLRGLGCLGVAVVPPGVPNAVDGALLALLDGDPGGEGVAALTIFAEVLSIVVHQADPHPDALVRAGILRRTLDDRNTIEQAKGMLAERFGVSPDVAWIRLRARADALGIPIADAARAVVGRVDDDPATIGG
jgi:hypothetical protein